MIRTKASGNFSWIWNWGVMGNCFSPATLVKKDLLTRVEARDPFFKEVLNVWTEVNFEPYLKSIEHFNSQTLWLNLLFKISNKTFFYKDWFIMRTPDFSNQLWRYTSQRLAKRRKYFFLLSRI